MFELGAGGVAMFQPRASNKQPLTAVAVRQLITPGRYADGNGLYLVVDPSGARRWLLRIVIQRRRRDIGLGSARLVPLATARDTAIEMRRLARDGGDAVRRLVECVGGEIIKCQYGGTLANEVVLDSQ